jgi:phosphatidate phosphatase PAH1
MHDTHEARIDLVSMNRYSARMNSRALSSLSVLAGLVLGACAAAENGGDVGYDPREADGAYGPIGVASVPDVRCAAAPNAGATKSWRHFSSRLVAVGSPKHRGFDLIVSSSATSQVLSGEISYGTIDKALEDERVDLFACRAGAWVSLGSALTDGEGAFRLPLSGASLLPIGMRDLFVSVQGDRTGTRFLALVNNPGSALAVSDVDGTLTSSENAFTTSLLTGADVALHAGATTAFSALVARGYQPVYLTARGDIFTQNTRDWLAAKGLPRGPMRLAPSAITLPGDATVAFKAGAMAAIKAAGYDVAVGIGNRASDVAAYAQTGLAGNRVFIKLPEFTSEVQADLTAGRATGFASYGDVASVFGSLPLR